MKKLFMSLWLAVLMLPFVGQCQNAGEPGPAGEPVVRWHFASRAALAQGTNALRLKLVDVLPLTANLRSQIASNLAGAPRKFWDKELPVATPDGTQLLRPLFEDLLQAESYGEVRGPSGHLETAMAIELSDDRARLWSTNLWQLVAAWKQGTPTPLAQDGVTGWEVKRAQGPNVLQLARAGKWTILALGQDRLTLAPAWLQQIKSTGRPAPATPGVLVNVQADSPALGKWFPLFTDLGLPPLHLTMSGRGDGIRTEVKLRYATPLAISYEPWRIPTNMIGEPLSSFTVARGVAPLIGRLLEFQSLGIGPTPNQVCLWGITNDPARAYFTFPVENASAAVQKLAITGPRLIEKLLGQYMGEFFYASNRNTLIWGGLPYIQPYLQGVTNAGTQFITGGVFPLAPRQVPVPLELFAQIGTRTNLLYYDWEMTPFRILHANQLYQILDIASRRLLQPPGTASKGWLLDMVREMAKDAMNPSQTVTEITQTAPNELTLTRKSHLGLTGFEIATLSAWLDSPGFPFRYEPPRRMRMPQGTNAAGILTNRPAASPKR